MFQFQCFCLKSSHNAIPRYPDGVGSFSDTHIFISDVSDPALHRVHTILPACWKTSSRIWFGENWLIGHWLKNTSLHQIEYLSRSRRRQYWRHAKQVEELRRPNNLHWIISTFFNNISHWISQIYISHCISQLYFSVVQSVFNGFHFCSFHQPPAQCY